MHSALTDPVIARAKRLRCVCPTTRTSASRAASTSTLPPYPWTTDREMVGVGSMPSRARATALSWTAVARAWGMGAAVPALSGVFQGREPQPLLGQ